MTRGRYGLLGLYRTTLSFATPRRFIPAHLHASFRPHLAVTPLRFATLHLHQVGTQLPNMHGVQEKGQPLSQDGWPRLLSRGLRICSSQIARLRALDGNDRSRSLAGRLRTRTAERTASPVFNKRDAAASTQEKRMAAGDHPCHSRFPSLVKRVKSKHEDRKGSKSQNEQREDRQKFANGVELDSRESAEKQPHPFTTAVFLAHS